MEDITHLREGSRNTAGSAALAWSRDPQPTPAGERGLLADARTAALPSPRWPKIHWLVRLPRGGVSPSMRCQLPRRLPRRGRSHHCQQGRPGTCLKVHTTERPGICAARALMMGAKVEPTCTDTE